MASASPCARAGRWSPRSLVGAVWLAGGVEGPRVSHGRGACAHVARVDAVRLLVGLRVRVGASRDLVRLYAGPRVGGVDRQVVASLPQPRAVGHVEASGDAVARGCLVDPEVPL